MLFNTYPKPRSPEVDFDRLFEPMTVEQIAQPENFAKTRLTRISKWLIYCQKNNIYEYPTREYVEHLSRYLADRCAIVSERTGEEPRILELGAGQGRLSYLLSKKLPSADISAVDDFSWGEPSVVAPIVAKMDAREALASYSPHIVLASWVPLFPDNQPDWTSLMRAIPTVQEYLLIGEPENHANPVSWGLGDDGQKKYRLPESDYENEGFERVDLVDLKQFQVCREDYITDQGELTHRSSTVSFRRSRSALYEHNLSNPI